MIFALLIIALIVAIAIEFMHPDDFIFKPGVQMCQTCGLPEAGDGFGCINISHCDSTDKEYT